MNNGVKNKMELLQTLENDMKGCNRCELKKSGGKPFIGSGNADANLFLVGEAPTSSAEIKRKPLIGGTGAAIDKWLNYLGLNREQVYMTNAVKCVLRVKGGSLIACNQWLLKELEIIEPKIVLTVGAAALQSLIGKSICGFHADGYCQKIGIRHYCAMYHPARHSLPLDEDDKKILDKVRLLLEQERDSKT